MEVARVVKTGVPGRTASGNIIPASTGAAKAVEGYSITGWATDWNGISPP